MAQDRKASEEKTSKIVGLRVDGVLGKWDGSSVTWDDFITLLENNGFYFGGMTQQVDMDNYEEE